MQKTGNPLVDKIRDTMARGIVARTIVCVRTGEVLDYRTAVILVDTDGDPVLAMSQRGWAEVVLEGGDALLKATHGLTADPTTVIPGSA